MLETPIYVDIEIAKDLRENWLKSDGKVSIVLHQCVSNYVLANYEMNYIPIKGSLKRADY